MFMIVFQVFDLMGREESSEDLSQFVVDQRVGVIFQVRTKSDEWGGGGTGVFQLSGGSGVVFHIWE